MNFFRNIILKAKALNIKRIERYRLKKNPLKTAEGFLYKGPTIQFDNSWEESEKKLLLRILPSYDIFINIGAHYGYYVCMARKIGLAVIALEPLTINFKMLLENIKANNFGNSCILINAAAGSKSCIGEISGAFSTATMLKGNGNHVSLNQTIPVIKLDNIYNDAKKRKLVLMDVEGFEHEALLGSKYLLRDKNIDWIIEIFPFWEPKNAPRYENKKYFETFNIMIENGYNIWKIGYTLNKIEIVELEKTKLLDFNKRPSGNFLFSRNNFS